MMNSTGKPAPTVKWYREGREIEEMTSENTSISYDSSSGRATLIIKVASQRDAAKYTCVARNVLGSCSTTAIIHVQGFYTNSFACCWTFAKQRMPCGVFL